MSQIGDSAAIRRLVESAIQHAEWMRPSGQPNVNVTLTKFEAAAQAADTPVAALAAISIGLLVLAQAPASGITRPDPRFNDIVNRVVNGLRGMAERQ